MPERNVHFNEEEISAYDLQRGQCQTIDEPKTPFEYMSSASDEDMGSSANDGDVAEDAI